MFERTIHAARLAAVQAAMRAQGGGAMLLPAADEKRRNADNHHPFRQDSDFAWVTGFDEPDGAALVHADPQPGRSELVLFVRPKNRERKIWDGYRAGVEGAVASYGADAAHPVGEMEAKLEEYLARGGTLWYRLGFSREWDERVVRILERLRARIRTGVRAPDVVRDPGTVLHELRLVKSPEEVERLRRAAEITAEAHMAAMRDGRPGAREYQVQSEIEYAFRRRGGSGPGYGTIVAAGPNATILHYRAGNAELRAGELCLVDAGGEYGLYTADVTRTFPVSGEFTKAQRKAYDVVLAAELAGIEAVRPGATIDGIHDLVVRKLVEGMIALGLLSGTPEERIADGSYKKYYMHRTSHWLGMDVHDVGAYHVDGASRALVPGNVITVEPGLYVAADDAGAPEELRGIGIRIEDDVLVTADGHENLTAAVPKLPDEVELCCTR
ncbi:MAG TPA: aminopeptidase P N-terminal domain-containing protein [Anaeromyxobacteraceae bacterium]|nr:aminopeptidase P N-terminal domain-containing protein [Anaeromyxobacteraceae bacterium]